MAGMDAQMDKKLENDVETVKLGLLGVVLRGLRHNGECGSF